MAQIEEIRQKLWGASVFIPQGADTMIGVSRNSYGLLTKNSIDSVMKEYDYKHTQTLTTTFNTIWYYEKDKS